MANMSYCRFENTAGDLLDCCEADDPTSVRELKARVRLYKLCERFVSSFELEDLEDDLKAAIEEEKREAESIEENQ